MQSPAPKRNFHCQFCHKKFPRLEHVQRHERTHTKETPFKCPCGRSFSRKDLLRRHEKAVHNGERVGRYETQALHASRTANLHCISDPLTTATCLNTETAAGLGADATAEAQSETTLSLPQFHSHGGIRQIAADFSEGVEIGNHTNVQSESSASWHFGQIESGGAMITRPVSQITVDGSMFDDVAGDLSAFYDQLDGIDSFFDMVDHTSSTTEDQDILGTLQQPNLGPSERSEGFHLVDQHADRQSNTISKSRPDQEHTFSRFGSPLPSPNFAFIGPVTRDAHHYSPTGALRPWWRITRAEHQQLTRRIEEFSSVLPKQFLMPSRYSLSRYLEGCIRGLCEHAPFLHIPTFSIPEAAPELVLAMAAIGAQFRFEDSKTHVLFYSARSIVLQQVRRRDQQKVEDNLSYPDTLVGNSNSPRRAPHSTDSRQVPGSLLQERSTNVNAKQFTVQRLQTIQALFTLLVMGAWGPQQIFRESSSLQALAAALVREDISIGFGHERTENVSEWHTWALMESRKRAALAVYSILQMISVAYNTPPLMLSSEIDCRLPAEAELWNAKTENDWKEACSKRNSEEASFRDGVESLYKDKPVQNIITLSPFANYVIILAILQHIYLRRQDPSISDGEALDAYDTTKTGNALKRWQKRWERSPESNIDPFSSAGPVAFNSTALLRLAWVRLYADLGPCRNLASRDIHLVVSTFKNCTLVKRSPELIYPVLQASYALALPIRMGLQFVAKTQTLNWSVQHSLSNLECAIFLSMWLETMAITSATASLERDEVMLIQMIHGLLKETELFQDNPEDITEPRYQQRKIRWLAKGVAKIWAEIFKSAHAFEAVNVIGTSLAIYAESMEHEFEQAKARLDGGSHGSIKESGITTQP